MIRKDKAFSWKNRARNRNEGGNAAIYVLIVVALFAALTFILTRQHDTSEQGSLSYERTQVLSNQVVQVSNQLKQGIDQMIYSGSTIDDLNFCLPAESCFTSGPTNMHKVFHTEGGGMVMPRLQEEAMHDETGGPAPGFYIGRFNNVEWTQTTAQDVILAAVKIRKELCEQINKGITGSSEIPTPDSDVFKMLVKDSSNADLTADECEDCEGHPALCVHDGATNTWTYYSVIEQQ